jgi:phosphoribosylformimino-5-aminoimidazole carboxamide ribonucleotide (ProFAR) isomerase
MAGRVVQLVRGERKALEREDPLAMLDEFAGFSDIQVIDLDAALGRGSNGSIVRALCERAARDGIAIRAGGGVRSVERAQELAAAGADKIIVGTAAFSTDGIHHDFLRTVAAAVGRDHLMLALDSREGRIVVRGWRQSTQLTAEEAVRQLEPYCTEVLCTFVDREGTMTGTDLDWFARLRAVTPLAITAAGGIHTLEEIQALDEMGINAAVGMAVYTGKLSLDVLRTVFLHHEDTKNTKAKSTE